MVMVKICGVRRPEDARACRDARVDLAGLNFVRSSRREVSVEEARRLIDALGPVQPVGLFADSPRAFVAETVEELQLPWIQLHGQESAQEFASMSGRVRIIRAFAEPGPHPADLAAWMEIGAIPLFDGPEPGRGIAAEWRRRHVDRGFFVSGGLGPQNVAEALRITGASGVDVATGVERHGQIDAELVDAFVRNARARMEEAR